MSNKLLRLFQVIGYVELTDTSFFIYRNKVPKNAKITYFCIVCNIRHQNKEMHQVLITVGRDNCTYNGPVSTPTLDMATSKLHWNSVLLTPGSKYLVIYVKNITPTTQYYSMSDTG